MIWFYKQSSATNELINSSLYDDSTFYARFAKDLKNCHTQDYPVQEKFLSVCLELQDLDYKAIDATQ
jgi:hypothetical protein